MTPSITCGFVLPFVVMGVYRHSFLEPNGKTVSVKGMRRLNLNNARDTGNMVWDVAIGFERKMNWAIYSCIGHVIRSSRGHKAKQEAVP